jgi:hypothetical protein
MRPIPGKTILPKNGKRKRNREKTPKKLQPLLRLFI